MLPEISFRDRTVLVTDVQPADSATVLALLRDGAVVTVSGDPLPTSVLDLVQRGLVSATAEPDPAAYDVVVRGGRSHREPAPAVAGAVGTVTLLGGGPGDPGLLTVAGLEAIRTADVIVHDRLAPLEALVHARHDAEVVDVGKIPRGEFTPQERINELLVEHALAGRNVLRFKGGDNFVFGRGGEEAQACAEAGVPVAVIPGVSSSIAGPALAGIPVTHRTLVQGFCVVSGHVPPGDPRGTVDWAALARTGLTIVVLMGVANLAAIADALVAAGLDGETPAAVVADAGLPSMATARAPLADIAAEIRRAGIGAPAVVVIGEVAALDVLA